KALEAITAAMPAGEVREGQIEMAEAVARAVVDGHHLVAQAGTGTGKTLAYLVPVILAGRRRVVATATKALQDQLAGKDLPFLAEHLGEDVSYALLKGRSNYVCLQRVAEVGQGADQLALDGLAKLAPASTPPPGAPPPRSCGGCGRGARSRRPATGPSSPSSRHRARGRR